MIKGHNVYLRALEPSDIDLLYAWENDVDIWNLSNTVTPFSKHVLEQYVATAHLDIYSSKQSRFVICKNPDHPIGSIDLFDFDPINSRVGIGILIADKNERGCGYASDALSVLVKYCFEILNLHQVYCNITVDNEPSLRLFEKAGFIISGVKKQWIRSGNQFKDEYLLQLLNE